MGGELRFDGRVCLVTGAGSGLGRRYAIDLAQRGAAVVVNDYGGVSVGKTIGISGGIDKAAAVVREITAAGGKAVANDGSVSNFDACQQMVEQAVREFGRLDVVIVNAGVAVASKFEEATEDDYDVTMGVHVKGAFNVVRHAWPLFLKQNYGRLVLTSSSSTFGIRNVVLYGTAKSAMIGMVNSLRLEARHHNITVNAIMPAAATAMTLPPQADKSQRAQIAQIPMMDPAFSGSAVIFMCHESMTDSGEVVSAEAGAYSRVATVMGPRVKLDSKLMPSPEFVRDHWENIMAVNSDGTRADMGSWSEMAGALKRHRGRSLRERRSPHSSKL